MRRVTLVVLVVALCATVTSALEWAAPGAVYDPELTVLFTPEGAPHGAYQVWRSAESIEGLAERLRGLDPEPLADAWKVLRVEPGAVFTEGPFDRGRLARLYVGHRLSVARGALRTDEGVLAFTLIAPWPDATLRSLEKGTLVIVTRLRALLGAPSPTT